MSKFPSTSFWWSSYNWWSSSNINIFFLCLSSQQSFDVRDVRVQVFEAPLTSPSFQHSFDVQVQVFDALSSSKNLCQVPEYPRRKGWQWTQWFIKPNKSLWLFFRETFHWASHRHNRKFFQGTKNGNPPNIFSSNFCFVFVLNNLIFHPLSVCFLFSLCL